MPLGSTKDDHFSCFHSSCQWGLMTLIHVSQKSTRWWLKISLEFKLKNWLQVFMYFSKLWNNSVLQNCESKAQCAKDHVGNKVCMVMDAFIVQKQKRETKVFLAMLCPCVDCSRSKHFLHLPHDLYWDFTQTDEWAGHIFLSHFFSLHIFTLYLYWVSY